MMMAMVSNRSRAQKLQTEVIAQTAHSRSQMQAVDQLKQSQMSMSCWMNNDQHGPCAPSHKRLHQAAKMPELHYQERHVLCNLHPISLRASSKKQRGLQRSPYLHPASPLFLQRNSSRRMRANMCSAFQDPRRPAAPLYALVACSQTLDPTPQAVPASVDSSAEPYQLARNVKEKVARWLK